MAFPSGGIQDLSAQVGYHRIEASCVRCPGCGWSDVRVAMHATLLDHVLRAFALRAFRCRCCGKRFRSIVRGADADAE